MEYLVAAVVLVVSMAVVVVFGRSKSSTVNRNSDEVLGAAKPKVEYPLFSGDVLEIPNNLISLNLLKGTVARYVGLVRQLEQGLGLGMNEPVEAADEVAKELQELRYRVILLNWMSLPDDEGRHLVDTGEIYNMNATCGQPFFYPELFAKACQTAEKDVASFHPSLK
ncbi:MAG: hypothetical protein HY226_03965 [Candidatus Vogelbacteria bacterium]|nr:hypothetical protein [Candidatus Vogelbacteria bacterium]